MYTVIDFETNGLDVNNPKLPIHCFAYQNLDSNLVPYHEPICLEWSKESRIRLQTLNQTTIWIAHNATFDIQLMRTQGINVKPFGYHDTLVMSHTLCPSNSSYHKLDSVAKRFSMEKIDYRETLVNAGLLDYKAPKGAEFAVAFNEHMERYVIQDVKLASVAFCAFMRQLKCDTLMSVYERFRNFEEYIMLLNKGVWVDRQKLIVALSTIVVDTLSVKQELLKQQPTVPNMKWDKVNGKFIPKDNKVVGYNPDSTYHNAFSLIIRGFEPKEYTDGGLPKTGIAQLEDFRQTSKFADDLCKYSELSSRANQIGQILELSSTGKLKASWHLCNTRTHRLSSSNPNCQNIGSAERNEKNKPLREAFVAGKNHLLLCCDFSRIEVVMLAYMLELNGDSRMANALREGKDIHQANADSWGIARPEAKNGLFAITYGASPTRFALTVGIPVADAKRIIDNIYKNMPILTVLKEQTEQELKQHRRTQLYDVETQEWVSNGIVYDLFGSIYIYSHINSNNNGLRAKAVRQAFNVKCQGSVGSLMCMTAHELFPYMVENRARPVLQVHDELVFEVPESNIEPFKRAVQFVMNRDNILFTDKGGIPITVSIGVGSNWHEAKSK